LDNASPAFALNKTAPLKSPINSSASTSPTTVSWVSSQVKLADPSNESDPLK